MLHLRTVGIYHTDFPQYVQILTDDHFMESLTWRFMHWFYQQLDLIYVNSEQYRTSWMERGIDGDRRLQNPAARTGHAAISSVAARLEVLGQDAGRSAGELILLYVGRVSVEKNLDVFAAAHDRASGQRDCRVRAAIVGDGVYTKTMHETPAGRMLSRVIWAARIWRGHTRRQTCSFSRAHRTRSATS